MANNVDPDETPQPDETLRSSASHRGVHRLFRPVCPNTYGEYGKLPRLDGSHPGPLFLLTKLQTCYKSHFVLKEALQKQQNKNKKKKKKKTK